jgi:hypothetical protein
VQQVLIKTCEARTSSGGIGLQFTEGELQGAVESSREAPQVGEWLNKFSQREAFNSFRRNIKGRMDG